jgi:hypothetical protein
VHEYIKIGLICDGFEGFYERSLKLSGQIMMSKPISKFFVGLYLQNKQIFFRVNQKLRILKTLLRSPMTYRKQSGSLYYSFLHRKNSKVFSM